MTPAAQNGTRPKGGGSKPKGDRVMSVDQHAKGWRLRYSEAGHVHYEYRRTRESIEQRRAYHASRLEGNKPPPEPIKAPAQFGDGTSSDWAKVLWMSAKRVLSDKQDENVRAVARTIAQLAASAHKHMDMQNIIEEQDELREMVRTITSARKNAIRPFGRASAVEEAPGPGESIQ